MANIEEVIEYLDTWSGSASRWQKAEKIGEVKTYNPKEEGQWTLENAYLIDATTINSFILTKLKLKMKEVKEIDDIDFPVRTARLKIFEVRGEPTKLEVAGLLFQKNFTLEAKVEGEEEEFAFDVTEGKILIEEGKKYVAVLETNYHMIYEQRTEEGEIEEPSDYGDGSVDNPFKIYFLEDLDDIRNNTDKHFVLWRSLDFDNGEHYRNPATNKSAWTEGTGWTPIPTFSGTLEGKNYTIKNLFMENATSTGLGLFLEIDTTGELHNLIIEDSDVTSTYTDGYSNNASAICKDNKGLLDNCNVVGGTFTSGWHVGGLCRTNTTTGIIRNSSCSGTMTITDEFVGGICTGNNGLIEKTNFTGTIANAAASFIGGISGENRAGGIIRNCFFNGTLGNGNVKGGIVGNNETTVSHCYSTGTISSTGENIGGAVGFNSGSVIYTYYDSETTGMSDTGKGVGRTTAQMKARATYLTWDFVNNWEIDEGNDYPKIVFEKFYFITKTNGYAIKVFFEGTSSTEQRKIQAGPVGNQISFMQSDSPDFRLSINTGEEISFKYDLGYNEPKLKNAKITLEGFRWNSKFANYLRIMALAGKGKSDDISDLNSVAGFVEKAVAQIMAWSRMNIVKNWEKYPEETRDIIKSLAEYLSAIIVVNYDIDGYKSRFEAQYISDYLQYQADRLLALLQENNTKLFLEKGE